MLLKNKLYHRFISKKYIFLLLASVIIFSCKRNVPPDGAYRINLYNSNFVEEPYYSDTYYIKREKKIYVLISKKYNVEPFDTLWLDKKKASGTIQNTGKGILEVECEITEKSGDEFILRGDFKRVDFDNFGGTHIVTGKIELKRLPDYVF